MQLCGQFNIIILTPSSRCIAPFETPSGQFHDFRKNFSLFCIVFQVKRQRERETWVHWFMSFAYRADSKLACFFKWRVAQWPRGDAFKAHKTQRWRRKRSRDEAFGGKASGTNGFILTVNSAEASFDLTSLIDEISYSLWEMKGKRK